MADRHPPRHAQGPRARGDARELLGTLFAGLMQVDVDLRAMAIGNAEHCVQLTIGVAIEGARIDAAHHLRAFPHGSLQPLHRAGTGHHPRLRKGNQFDIDQITPALAGAHDRMQMGELGGGVDIHMAAHRHGAPPRRQTQQRVGTFQYRRSGGQLTLFQCQPLAQRRGRLVRMPAPAHETLVQVDMAIDQSRQYQLATQIDGLDAGTGRPLVRQGGNAPLAHHNVQRRALRVHCVQENTLVHRGLQSDAALPAASCKSCNPTSLPRRRQINCPHPWQWICHWPRLPARPGQVQASPGLTAWRSPSRGSTRPNARNPA